MLAEKKPKKKENEGLNLTRSNDDKNKGIWQRERSIVDND